MLEEAELEVRALRLLRGLDVLAVALTDKTQQALLDPVLAALKELRQEVADLTKQVVIGLTPRPYLTFFVNATRSGNNEVVERVVDKKIQVVGYVLNNGNAAVATVHFRSGTRPISSTKDLAADGGGMVGALTEGFWFETAVGEALNINLLADGAVGVDVMYVLAEGE